MAIDKACGQCNAIFTTSASSYRYLCRKCDGTEQREADEAKRWAALTPDQKCDELLKRVKGLEQVSHWDGRIG